MRNTDKLQGTFFIICVASLMLWGCGSNNPDTAEVTGQVTLNGNPVISGRVIFFPIGTTGKLAQATLDEEGYFELRTYGSSDGAVIGQHRVTVMSNPDPTTGEDAKSLGTPDPEKVTVEPGLNEFHIQLMPHPQRRRRAQNNDEDTDVLSGED